MDKFRDPLELLAQNPVDLSLLSLKSKLMMIVTSLIRENDWTQAEAAKAIGVSQPRISNLMNGKISKFSIDMLIEMLGKLGYLMEITFDPSKKDNPIGMNVKKTAV